MSEFEQNCRKFFAQADVDKTGTLTKLELYKVVKKAGVDKTADEVVAWFDELDKNDDDQVTLEEFLSELMKVPMEEKTEAELRAAFRQIDTDGSGYITLDEVKANLKKRGIDPKNAVLDLDTDADGKVNFEEFLKALRKK